MARNLPIATHGGLMLLPEWRRRPPSSLSPAVGAAEITRQHPSKLGIAIQHVGRFTVTGVRAYAHLLEQRHSGPTELQGGERRRRRRRPGLRELRAAER